MKSFSPISFSSTSFSVGQENAPSTGSRKRNRFRAWLKSLQQFARRLFIKKKEEEPIPEVPIPTPQSPAGQKVTILQGPPPYEKLETLNDHWVMPAPSQSVVASSPPPEVYPLILQPSTIPTTQTRVALPRATKQSYIAPYRVGEGSHIESKIVGFKRPINRSKTASTLNTLLILLEIERQI